MEKASIILLSWNHEQYIEQCLRSCIEQTHQNIEVLCLDNNSSDNTYQLAERFLSASGVSYQLFKNEQPKGIAENLNFLLEKATGKYVAVLSTDDWFHVNNLEQKIKRCEQDPEVGAVFSNMWIYFEDTQKTEMTSAAKFKRGHIYKEIFNDPECINNIGNFYTREALLAVGGWDERQLIEDMDMNVQIALRYKIDFVAEPLLYYRRKNSSISVNIDYMIRGFERYYEKYKKETWVDMRSYLGSKYDQFAALSVDQGNYKVAINLIRKSIKYNFITVQKLKTTFYLFRKMLLNADKKK